MKGEYWERALLARRAFLRFLLLLLVFIGFYLTIFVEYGILKMLKGIRASKTVNGVLHEYVLNGSQILAEKVRNIWLSVQLTGLGIN